RAHRPAEEIEVEHGEYGFAPIDTAHAGDDRLAQIRLCPGLRQALGVRHRVLKQERIGGLEVRRGLHEAAIIQQHGDARARRERKVMAARVADEERLATWSGRGAAAGARLGYGRRQLRPLGVYHYRIIGAWGSTRNTNVALSEILTDQ